MPVGSPVVVVENARRAFGARQALAGVSLALSAGEIYALVGRNGAGKTTLIRAICGRARLDGGTVRLEGRDPAADAAARRRLGLVPQEIALYPELTALENLEILGRLAGLAAADARRRAREALAWIGLADRAKSRVATLSGGMKPSRRCCCSTSRRSASTRRPASGSTRCWRRCAPAGWRSC